LFPKKKKKERRCLGEIPNDPLPGTTLQKPEKQTEKKEILEK